jgi:hypothetical protein
VKANDWQFISARNKKLYKEKIGKAYKVKEFWPTYFRRFDEKDHIRYSENDVLLLVDVHSSQEYIQNLKFIFLLNDYKVYWDAQPESFKFYLKELSKA